MSNRSSLQKSLSIGLTLGVTLLWLLGVTASGLVAQHEMNEVFDSALEETAQRILPLAVTDILNRENGPGNQIAPAMKDHDEYLTYLVRDQQGNLLLQSHDADPRVFGTLPREGFSNTSTHRIYGASAVSDTMFIEVAEPLAHRREAALEAGLALLMPLVFLIPISLLGVWWIVRLSLRKVVEFQQSIESRGAGDLTPVAEDRLPKEFEPIAKAVNLLLERLHRALEAERSFTANSAHELRTPLATALAKVQRLQARIQGDQLKTTVTEIEEALQSLSVLSGKLLELAKAEGGGALSQNQQDLVPILAMIVDDFQRQAPGRIILSLPESVVNSFLDPDAFAILMRNLIENALKHGSQTRPVEVSMADDGLLRVRNGSDVVPPDQLALLRNRFARVKTGASGSGLGLAIADAIATGAGMTLHLRSPATGRQDGFEAELNVVTAR
ncbi:ATP-binding protein [Marinobacter halophilus]|uniref:histidine kinase n=1 Tax=Marinobacter halophilus TaxID=1323740 RepID=A0A2T1KFP6_9GAMM|nr:ATP-binding protein [Marinobacter halophilus]PSF08858.1 two-component sensor histidine kinase [Marinobacter halophilus]GGC64552.1 two-component sensor histidine kinase [Marinobacter halophilus]